MRSIFSKARKSGLTSNPVLWIKTQTKNPVAARATRTNVQGQIKNPRPRS